MDTPIETFSSSWPLVLKKDKRKKSYLQNTLGVNNKFNNANPQKKLKTHTHCYIFNIDANIVIKDNY